MTPAFAKGIGLAMIGLSRLVRSGVEARKLSLRKETERRAWKAIKSDAAWRTIKIGDVLLSRDGIDAPSLIHDAPDDVTPQDEAGVVVAADYGSDGDE